MRNVFKLKCMRMLLFSANSIGGVMLLHTFIPITETPSYQMFNKGIQRIPYVVKCVYKEMFACKDMSKYSVSLKGSLKVSFHFCCLYNKASPFSLMLESECGYIEDFSISDTTP